MAAGKKSQEVAGGKIEEEGEQMIGAISGKGMQAVLAPIVHLSHLSPGLDFPKLHLDRPTRPYSI